MTIRNDGGRTYADTSGFTSRTTTPGGRGGGVAEKTTHGGATGLPGKASAGVSGDITPAGIGPICGNGLAGDTTIWTTVGGSVTTPGEGAAVWPAAPCVIARMALQIRTSNN